MSDPIDDAVLRLAAPSAFDAGGAEADLRAHADRTRVAAALTAALRAGSWGEEARRRAVRLLGELPGEDAARAVLDAARAPEKRVRAEAAIALSRRAGDVRAEDALLELLSDPLRDVRAAALWCVERLKPGARFLPPLLDSLRSSARRTIAEIGLPADRIAPEIRQDQACILRALHHLVESPGFAEAARPLLPLLREIADDPGADDPAVGLDAGTYATDALARAFKGG